MDRTNEFVLGLIGGIFGIISGILAMTIGGLGTAFSAQGANTVGTLGIGAVLLSVLGIVGSILVKNKPKIGGLFRRLLYEDR